MLMSFHFDVDKIEMVKRDMELFNEKELTKKGLQSLKEKYIQFPRVSLFLLIHFLFANDNDMDIKKYDRFIYEILNYHIEEQLESLPAYHPVRSLVKENYRFRNWAYQLNEGMAILDEGWSDVMRAQMSDVIHSLGQMYNHFHVKEKLIFPVLERYGHSMFTREMWRIDDQMRGLYHGAKNMINHANKREPKHVRLTFQTFDAAFRSMIFQEEKFLFPIVIELFNEAEWLQIAKESSAYGYGMLDDVEASNMWHMLSKEKIHMEKEHKIRHIVGKTEGDVMQLVSGNGESISPKIKSKKQTNLSVSENDELWKTENIPFGGGFLTLEEANLILNNLPVEITFVDRNSIFKYFNQVTNAEDMMLVRTPLSIGRNVADCHPPKSLKKVMTLARDLKSGKRKSESMWFKKGDAYVYITYKGLFNEKDEFIGILEYVQDISSFLDLPKEVKRELTPLEDDQVGE